MDVEFYCDFYMNGIDIKFKKEKRLIFLIILGIRILWWKRAYKSPFSKFLISVEKSTPKLSVMS